MQSYLSFAATSSPRSSGDALVPVPPPNNLFANISFEIESGTVAWLVARVMGVREGRARVARGLVAWHFSNAFCCSRLQARLFAGGWRRVRRDVATGFVAFLRVLTFFFL